MTIRQSALVILVASIAILGAAFAFQYIGGLAPCVLCLYQRVPYAAAIAIAVLAWALADRPAVAGTLIALAGIGFMIGAGVGVFHVGVEQHWWEGTAACGSTLGAAGTVEELRSRLLAQPIVRCDQVAWSLIGISMAGYNVLLSLALAAFAAHTARCALVTRP
ncbi:MAG: disulfide bond formation protein B [Proteobacteria bacterium]|nr:disulfide bond formation protein B [Pseudomonadota bacterium]